ncbi:MAG: signal peptidase I [Pseudomonadota bacterium]
MNFSDSTRLWLGRLRAGLGAYLRTFAAVLLRREGLRDARPQEHGLLGPFAFYAASLALVTTVDRLVFADQRAFELPPGIERLTPIFNLVSELTFALSVIALIGQASLHWICFRMLRFGTTFGMHVKYMLYISSVTLVILQAAFNPIFSVSGGAAILSETREAVLGWLVLFYILFTTWWLAKLVKPNQSRTFLPFLTVLAANGLLFASLFFIDLRPTKPYWIPSSSMSPTLTVGDTFMINTWVFRWREPRRGEVVVFAHAGHSGALAVQESLWVKRVIALPGDRVRMQDGQVVLNGAALPQTRIEDHEEVFALRPRTRGTPRCMNGPLSLGAPCYKEQAVELLPNGVSYPILNLGEQRSDNTVEFVVPGGHYFVLGDNRDNSMDSRMPPRVGGPGFVARSSLRGAVYRQIVPVREVFNFPAPLVEE